jgi:hypothetical protein
MTVYAVWGWYWGDEEDGLPPTVLEVFARWSDADAWAVDNACSWWIYEYNVIGG